MLVQCLWLMTAIATSYNSEIALPPVERSEATALVEVVEVQYGAMKDVIDRDWIDAAFGELGGPNIGLLMSGLPATKVRARVSEVVSDSSAQIEPNSDIVLLIRSDERLSWARAEPGWVALVYLGRENANHPLPSGETVWAVMPLATVWRGGPFARADCDRAMWLGTHPMRACKDGSIVPGDSVGGGRCAGPRFTEVMECVAQEERK